MTEVDASSHLPRPAPRRPLIREGLVTAGLGAALYLVFSLGLAAAMSGDFAIRLETVPSLLLAVLGSWGLLLWFGAVAAIIALRREHTVTDRTRWILVAAVIAGLVDGAVRYGLGILYNGPLVVLLFALPLVTSLGTFVVAVGAGRLLAVQLLPRADAARPEARAATAGITRERLLRVTQVIALVVAWMAVLALGQQWFVAYFRLFGAAVTITDEQSTRYLVTAAVALVSAAAAIVLARIRRARPTASVVALVVALLVAFVLQVPSGRFWPDPQQPPASDDDYVPCFGEGDPNCIGG